MSFILKLFDQYSLGLLPKKKNLPHIIQKHNLGGVLINIRI